MRIVVLGLSLSSSWGNGHATTWRALLSALARLGHSILFLERDRPWYAAARDLPEPGFCELRLYDTLSDLAAEGPRIRDADAVLVGSYVPDGVEVIRFVQRTGRGLTAFYDIDTPVTLARLERGDREYLAPDLIPLFDVYFSFSAGRSLDILEGRYGAAAARPLYCSVDPAAYRPQQVPMRWDLGYLGTYSDDRQPALERLLIEPARRLPNRRFVVAGPQYPDTIAWPPNVERIDHLPPAGHAAFYNAMRWTLNVTRADMIRLGHSPSVRLFEAAACATPIISDRWPGLDELFTPDREIVIADTTEEVVARLDDAPEWALSIGRAARRRVLTGHTADHRAEAVERELLAARERARTGAARRLGA